MKSIPATAVVILNWNGRHHLETYLPSVLEHTSADIDLWVADNGSSDDSVAWLKEHHASRVSVLTLDQNWGFAEGYNRALQSIEAETYVLLNSDVRVVRDWVPSTLEAMERHGWDVASPAVVQDMDPERLEHAGAAGGWMDVDGFPFCVGRIFERCDKTSDLELRDRETFWASGACLFIRREAWLRACGFDGDLFAHFEEIDLCWRLKNMGSSVGCHGAIQVRHLGGGSLPSESPFKAYLNFRNALLVMLKNRPGWWPGFMFRRMTLDGLAAWRFLSQGKWALFWAVGKAHGALYWRLPKTLSKRAELRRRHSASPNTKGWWNRSIVWAHFVQGVQSVNELDDID